MTDLLLPPDLGIAAATPNLDANTASFKSPTVGSTRSVERLGDALRFQLNFTTVNDDPATKRQRGRLQAFLSSLRGQSARVWMTPPGALLRGSFPAAEMFANNDFSAGTSGWSTDANSQYTLSAIDRGVRATRSQVTTATFALYQLPSFSLGIPYALRSFVNAGKGVAPIALGSDGSGIGPIALSQGMNEWAFFGIPGARAGFYDQTVTTEFAGCYFDAKWASLSRCAQVDNGVNLLLNSDTPGTGTGWTVISATAGSASAAGPDGSSVAWGLFETVSTAQHLASGTAAVPSAAADYTASYFVKAGNRTWCYIQINDSTHSILQWFNLSTGAVGTFQSGTNFTFISNECVDCGNGWKRCILTFRKGSADTGLGTLLGSARSDTDSSFLGVATPAALLTWRASLAPSSVPVQPAQTVASALPTGTLQTGLQLNLKGLPLSTQGLLLPGDYFECGLQLNQIASPLDSDAAGLGTAILTRPPRNSPADGTGFVVNNPMGRFMVSSNSTGWNEMPGRMSDASLELVEDISF